MAELFEPIEINGMVLKNRSVRSATWTGLAAPDGTCTDKLVTFMGRLARGDIGLIITGFAYVMQNGQALPGQLGIYDDTLIPALLKMTKRVHAAGATVCMQIVHAGAQTVLREREERPFWGPSALPNKIFRKTPKAMTQREINETVHAFAQAAGRVKKAGFDAVQIHGAHGYLASQFLSPATNKRADKYGGSIENRARFLFQIYRAVRKSVGKEFPILIKLNGKDFVRGGLNEKDALFVAKGLDKLGIDAIEMSGGNPSSGGNGPARMKIRKLADEAYFSPLAKKIRRQINAPVILVGGVRSLKKVKEVLASDVADMISMSRPFIREPDLIKRWQQGNGKKASCISCNGCFQAARSPSGLHCLVEARLRKRNIR